MRQQDFARALLDPGLPPPEGLSCPHGPVARRFGIYRNNVTLGLTKALEQGFPLVRKLVGEAFFAAMARDFLRAHPPQSRILMFYGADFPAFLEGYAPVAQLGYLPDVARLEQAIRESYHAADAAPISPSRLSQGDPAELRLRLAPALRLIRSNWPLHAIWALQTGNGPPPKPAAEDVVVLRPGFDPMPHLLPPGGAEFILALQSGMSLGQSARPDLDLTAILTLLIQGNAIVEDQE